MKCVVGLTTILIWILKMHLHVAFAGIQRFNMKNFHHNIVLRSCSASSCICDGIVLKFVHAIRVQSISLSFIRKHRLLFCAGMENFAKCHHFVLVFAASFSPSPLICCFVILAFGGCYFQYFGQALKLKNFFLCIDNLLLCYY